MFQNDFKAQARKAVALFSLLLSTSLFNACSSNDAEETDPDSPIDQSPSNPETDVTISGTVTFDFVPHRSTNSALNYLETQARAARGVTVQLLDARGQLLRETRSDESGAYSLGAPENTQVRVRVVAELERNDNADWQIRVADNTDGNAIYAMSGSLTTSGNADSTRDLHAPSGWVDDEYNAERVAGPFAILDAIYDALVLLEAADPNVSLEPAEIRWSTENRAIDGELEDGDIGTSFFHPGNGNIYLLGWADNDTDEYDRSVIQHEFAHLIEHQIMRTDNIGGTHRTDDALDMRVAFSEGWGNAFAGMAANDPFYRDSGGPNQDLGFAIALEEIETSLTGWFSEGSINNLLFDIFDTGDESGDELALGFTPIYQAMTHANFVESEAMLGLHVFVESLNGLLTLEQQTALSNMLAIHNITGEDAFGFAETNDASNADALPLYQVLDVGSTIELCTNNTYGEWNKLANRRFIYLDAAAAETRTLTFDSNGRAAPEIWIDIFQRGEFVEGYLIEDSQVEVDFEAPASGRYILEYYEEPNVDDNAMTGGRVCINVSLD